MHGPGFHVYTTDYVTMHSQVALAVILVPADEMLTKMSIDFLDIGCFRVHSTSSKHITWFHGFDVTDDIAWLTTHTHTHTHTHARTHTSPGNYHPEGLKFVF